MLDPFAKGIPDLHDAAPVHVAVLARIAPESSHDPLSKEKRDDPLGGGRPQAFAEEAYPILEGSVSEQLRDGRCPG
jgi:hypothetical protein